MTDSTGAVIPNATLSAKNDDTNVVRTTQSNSEGLYVIPNLIPGKYTLLCEFGQPALAVAHAGGEPKLE